MKPTDQQPNAKIKAAVFHTLAGSNKGARCILNAPDGKPTEAWIDVRGVDSEIFNRANNTSRRAMVEYLEKHGDTKEVREGDAFGDFCALQKRKLRAALVMAWSFEDPCDEAHVLDLFLNAPDVAQQVDVFASKREKFVGA